MYLVLEPPAWRAWTRQRRGRKAEKSPGHQIRGQNIITPGNEGAGGGRRHPRSGSHLYREEAIGRRSGEALSCHSPRRARWSAPRPRRWPAPRTAASPPDLQLRRGGTGLSAPCRPPRRGPPSPLEAARAFVAASNSTPRADVRAASREAHGRGGRGGSRKVREGERG